MILDYSHLNYQTENKIKAVINHTLLKSCHYMLKSNLLKLIVYAMLCNNTSSVMWLCGNHVETDKWILCEFHVSFFV